MMKVQKEEIKLKMMMKKKKEKKRVVKMKVNRL